MQSELPDRTFTVFPHAKLTHISHIYCENTVKVSRGGGTDLSVDFGGGSLASLRLANL